MMAGSEADREKDIPRVLGDGIDLVELPNNKII